MYFMKQIFWNVILGENNLSNYIYVHTYKEHKYCSCNNKEMT